MATHGGVSMRQLQHEFSSEESLATTQNLGRLRVSYDNALRKDECSLKMKYEYAKTLCFSSSRSLVRMGIELFREIQSYLEDLIDIRAKSSSRRSSLTLCLSELTFVREITMPGTDSKSDFLTGSSEMFEQNPAEEPDDDQICMPLDDGLCEIVLLDLCKYYTAVAFYRIGECRNALSLCDNILERRPNNTYVSSLRRLCLLRVANRGAIGVLLTMGLALPLFYWHKGSNKSSSQ